MRWWMFIGLQVVIIAAAIGVVRMHDDHVLIAKKPPLSLAQWYKPQNKRQVWLHTMFNLRRELVAIETYAAAEDDERLNAWSAKLDKDYRKLADMVPEWSGRVDLEALAALRKGVAEKRYKDVIAALEDVNKSCQSCHTDFRAVTAALYRAPDFASLTMKDGSPYDKHMDHLSRQVNAIKIAYGDGRDADALAAFGALKSGMATLGDTCVNCHKKLGTKAYPNATQAKAMAALERALKTDDEKAKGRSLGMVAVLACAQCHGTHRLAFDAKEMFRQTNDWKRLIQHR